VQTGLIGNVLLLEIGILKLYGFLTIVEHMCVEYIFVNANCYTCTKELSKEKETLIKIERYKRLKGSDTVSQKLSGNI
jgi:hypothetical protein